MRMLPAIAVLAAALAHGQTVTGVGNFIHNVANLDKSLEFYRDVLGMELQRAAAPRPFLTTPEILNLYNASGGQYRVGTTLVPDSPMRAELAEFKDVDRKPVQPRIQDPGASILILGVRDLAGIMARVKQSGATVVTPGEQSVLLRDPDGFFVELIEKGVADVSFAFVVSDTDRMLRVFKDALGFQFQTGPFLKDKLFGIEKAEVRRSTALVPGTSFQVAFLEFKGIDRKPVHCRPQDPGAAVLRLVVRDAESAAKALDAAGAKVASPGGQVVKLPGGTARAAIAAAPDNLFVQVLQPQ